MNDIAGSEWESKDGARALIVLGEAPDWRGERMVTVRGVRGSNRQRQITYAGLIRKYDQVERRRCGHRLEARCSECLGCTECERPDAGDWCCQGHPYDFTP